jgi:predicted dehydrogenase
MRPIRVGVVGAGAAAEGIHLPALARTAGIETVAIVDPAADRVEHIKRKFGVPAGYRDYRTRCRIDAPPLIAPVCAMTIDR